MNALLVLVLAALIILVFMGWVAAGDAGNSIGWLATNLLSLVERLGDWTRGLIVGRGGVLR